MRLPLLSIALVATTSACSPTAPHVHESFAPVLVERFADEQLDTTSPEHQEEFRRYALGFFRGYVDPNTDVYTRDVPSTAGRNAGISYRRKNPNSFRSVLATYGYEPVTSAGRFAFGFEEMAFVPADGSSERWWLANWLGSGDVSEHSPCPRGTVQGYISPRGHHGHLGFYTHELVAQTFRCDG